MVFSGEGLKFLFKVAKLPFVEALVEGFGAFAQDLVPHLNDKYETTFKYWLFIPYQSVYL